MEGVRQGCMLGLIVLFLILVKGQKLEVSVPADLEVYRGKPATFAVVYAPNTTKDDVLIQITKNSINAKHPVLNISMANDSRAVIDYASGWSSKMSVKHDYNKFFVTFSSVQREYNGVYSVSVKVNGEKEERRMFLHVLEKPVSVNIEILTPSFGPFSENTLVNFSCTGIGGRGVGELTLARKTAGDVSYFPLKAEVLDSETNEITRVFNYTYQTLLDRHDNGSEYVCEIHDGPFFQKSGPMLRSAPVEVEVDFSGTNLNTSPSIITIGGQNNANVQLTISCSPTGATSVLAMVIGNYNQNNVKNPIVRIVVKNPNTIEVVDKSLQQRMTQTGSINDDSGSLEIVLSDLRCTDASMYYCTVTDSTSSGNVINDETTTNVTARTYPEEITMNINPRYTTYDVGNLVEFNCHGRIGNQFPTNMASFWVWQWRYIGSSTSSWTSYPNSNNITYEDPTVAANCQYNGRSRLFHTVTTSDNGRQFRCYVLSNAEYGGNYTVYTETPPATGNPDTVGGDDPSSASLGPILGGVFAALAVIIIIVVLVYIFVFRRKSGGDDYDTGEAGKDERPPMTDNVVYSTPASRDNKPSRMKGRENDAMDEPHEKNPRPYYANDYDRGRSNPAMDEDSKHNRSYDDDNTDSRMRAPYGSAV